jgi:hypothetical protein
MKNLAITIIITICLIACKNNKKAEVDKTSNVSTEIANTVVSDFLQDINTLKNVNAPIAEFIKVADKQAVKKMPLSKENIKQILETAKNFKHLGYYHRKPYNCKGKRPYKLQTFWLMEYMYAFSYWIY